MKNTTTTRPLSWLLSPDSLLSFFEETTAPNDLEAAEPCQKPAPLVVIDIDACATAAPDLDAAELEAQPVEDEDEDDRASEAPLLETVICQGVIQRKKSLEIFHGYIPTAHQNVVVKRIYSDGASGEEAKCEAEVLSGLDHPNVIKCIGVVENRECLDIIMEKGVSLRKARSEREFSEEEITGILRDICEGLAHIHAQGIIHFDLKCDNIILVDGRAKLADFGSSLPLTDIHVQQLTRGTFPFMSPEVIRGLERGTSTDIWSLGATLYELVTGQPPFQGENFAVAYAVATQKALPPLPAHFQVSPKIAQLITQCTNSDPALRPTAQELLQLL